MAIELVFLYIIASKMLLVHAQTVQNCTKSVCDLKTCADATQPCTQNCYTRNCRMVCSSAKDCKMFCHSGGCSNLSCDMPKSQSSSTQCLQECSGNCNSMTCKASSCHLKCLADNCKMTCHNSGAPGVCLTECKGKGCHMDVHSTSVEGSCINGSCVARFSKKTSGYLACPAGNCSLTCANGTYCRFEGSCPNCKGPVFVVDPFAKSNATRNIPNVARLLSMDISFFLAYGIWLFSLLVM